VSGAVIPREARTDRACRLVKRKPWSFENPEFIGHCSVAFAGGWVMHKVPVFRRGDGTISAGVPSIPHLGGARVLAMPVSE
jgi:hypothetical protein